jgi:hypothetical protein
LSLWYVRRKPCTYLASRLALSPNGPTLTQSPNGLKQDSTRPTSPGSSTMCVQNNFRAYGMFGANPALILHWHWHYLQTDWNEDPLEPCHLGVPSSASKMIYEPMVCLAQTVHQSYANTNIVSTWTETRFHLSLVTKVYHRVRPKWFMSLWYVGCKSFTLTLSLNGLKWASTWASSPRISIWCVQNDFLSNGTLGENRAPILRENRTMSKWTNTNTVPKWTKMRFHMAPVTKEFHRVCSKRFHSLWYVRCKPCTYLVSRLVLSPNGLK